tara:strand:+ start:215 stop:463 length:249 start_codon:yes stop_codon:yes gene_type:complete
MEKHIPRKGNPKTPRSEAVCRAQKNYYNKNKEELNKYCNEYHKKWNIEYKMCSCGLEIKNFSYVKHLLSKNHMKRLINMRDT